MRRSKTRQFPRHGLENDAAEPSVSASIDELQTARNCAKRVTRPMLGFTSFEAAQDTLVGIERMHMIKQKQLLVEAGDAGLTAAELFYSLAASFPHRQGYLPRHDLLLKICDTTFIPPYRGIVLAHIKK